MKKENRVKKYAYGIGHKPGKPVRFIFMTAVLILSSSVQAQKNEFKPDDLKKMGTFLSNFTELSMYDFNTEELLNTVEEGDIIRFGIRHNYSNNYHSRISNCKVEGCPHGSLVIDAKYVSESIKKYFGVDFKDHRTIDNDRYRFFYDGKQYHFEGSDGEAVCHARVDEAYKKDDFIVMKGELYYTEDKDDKLGTFEALTKPHTYNGKNTWAIINMKTDYYDE
jgi:hypothetical protein